MFVTKRIETNVENVSPLENVCEYNYRKKFIQSAVTKTCIHTVLSAPKQISTFSQLHFKIVSLLFKKYSFALKNCWDVISNENGTSASRFGVKHLWFGGLF